MLITQGFVFLNVDFNLMIKLFYPPSIYHPSFLLFIISNDFTTIEY